MRTISAVATAALIVLGGPRCGAAEPTPPAAAAVTIRIKNFAFDPVRVTIRRGERVAFVNDDDDVHTATAVDKTFDSAALDAGQTWEHVFSRAGTYPYFCALHPYMKATIVVLPQSPPAAR